MVERSSLRLWLYGGGMLLPVLYFARRYPLRGATEERTDLGKLSEYGRDEFVLFVVGFLLLTGLYFLALRETRRLPARTALPAVFGCGTALAAGMTYMYPVNASDIFIYAVHSRLFSRYGSNPSAVFAKDFRGDPWLKFISAQWARFESPYGPLWNLVAAPITWLAGDRFSVAIVGFKLLALGCLLTGAWVIARALHGSEAPNAATGALFFLWNPLILWEAVGNGHNDVVMLLPVLLALLAWSRRRDALVVPLLVVAALVKYVPVILIPLAAVALWRRAESWSARRRLLAGSVILSLLALAIGFYPFYDLHAVRTSLGHHSRLFRLSVVAVTPGLFRGTFPMADVARQAKLISIGSVLLVLAWQVIVLWFRPERLQRAMFEVAFVFLLVARWNFAGWYLIWLVGLAAFLPPGWATWRTALFAAGAMAYYPFSIWIQAWYPISSARVQLLAVLMWFVPVLLLALAQLVSFSIRKVPGLLRPAVPPETSSG